MVIEKYKEGFKPTKDLSEKQLRAKKYIIRIFLCLVAYLLGFLYFALSLEYKTEYPNEKTDAIIILTGETKRIVDGINEFAKGNADRLFISGVHRQAPIEKVINKSIAQLQRDGKLLSSPDAIRSRIETGIAENTIENALESAVWAGKNNIKSIRLITSYYHMPRAKLLFKKYLPKKTIIYHPIPLSEKGNSPFSNPKILYLVFGEYNKYMLTYLWNLSGIETKTAVKIQGVL